MLKPFMRYNGNKICSYERTNERSGRTALKHNAFADTVVGEGIKRSVTVKKNRNA